MDQVRQAVKRALVIGCSDNVWAEVEQAQALADYDAIYCVKLAGVHWKGGRFSWVTLHPEFMADYKAQRTALGLHDDYEVVGPLVGEVGMHGKHPLDRRITYRYPGMNASASSGGFAAKIALDDGADRVVLAGVPMVSGASHFTRGKPWLQRDSFTPGFELSIPHFKGRVRAMSGWTKEILGEPTPEWLLELAA